jgi:hypothetical protein
MEVVIVISLKDEPQAPFEIVHRKVAVPLVANPVTVDVGELGDVIVAVPETSVHVPVIPDGIALPFNVVDVAQAAKV